MSSTPIEEPTATTAKTTETCQLAPAGTYDTKTLASHRRTTDGIVLHLPLDIQGFLRDCRVVMNVRVLEFYRRGVEIA